VNIVMRGLVPRIHVFRAAAQDVDARHKAGHDDDGVCLPEQVLPSAGRNAELDSRVTSTAMMLCGCPVKSLLQPNPLRRTFVSERRRRSREISV
jgi:hypothetical protein